MPKRKYLLSLEKCAATGKIKYNKTEAGRLVRFAKNLKAYYRCEHCGEWHTSSQKRSLDKQMYTGDNPLGHRLMGEIKLGRGTFSKSLSDCKSYYVVRLDGAKYLVMYNKIEESCYYRVLDD